MGPPCLLLYLNLSVMLSKYLQQMTSADLIFFSKNSFKHTFRMLKDLDLDPNRRSASPDLDTKKLIAKFTSRRQTSLLARKGAVISAVYLHIYRY